MKYLLLCLSFMVAGCGGSGSQQPAGKPTSNGRNGELLVVAPDALWDGQPGQWVKAVFATPAPGLPQGEPLFKVIRVRPTDFNSLLIRTRNILILDVEDTAAYLRLKTDPWAAPQMVAEIKGPDADSVMQVLLGKGKTLRQQFLDREMAGIGQRLGSDPSKWPSELKGWDFQMSIPKGFTLSESTPNCVVWWSRGKRSDQALLVYRYPRNGQLKPVVGEVLAIRDSITMLNVPGDRANSYMEVEQRYPPFVEWLDLNDQLALSIRSLWRTEGDFMGGPFHLVVLPSADGQYWLVADGFAYAPEIPKRPLMMEIEGILRTARISTAP
jgi:hypothetical protein